MIVEGNFGKFGNKIAVDWSYGTSRILADEYLYTGEKDTHCSIRSLSEGNTENSYGTAYLNPKDRFEKDKGRKVSLEKALKAAKFDKEQRQLIWAAYHARKNKVAEVRFTIPTSKLSSVMAGIVGALNEK